MYYRALYALLSEQRMGRERHVQTVTRACSNKQRAQHLTEVGGLLGCAVNNTGEVAGEGAGADLGEGSAFHAVPPRASLPPRYLRRPYPGASPARAGRWRGRARFPAQPTVVNQAVRVHVLGGNRAAVPSYNDSRKRVCKRV